MPKTPRRFRSVAVVAVTAIALAACNNNNGPTDGGGGGGGGGGGNAVTLKGSVIAGETMTLDATKTYTVQGFFTIAAGGQLVVPAGTQLLSDPATKGSIITQRCEGDQASGQLIVQGTMTNPVVFRPAGSGARQRGTGGGIVLHGCAPVNFAGGSGISEGVGLPFGGDDPNDSSGEIHYLVIEFGGVKVTPDNEINGLTFAGVGAGTIVDHVQSHFIADDGFEWFGGTVNANHLVSSGNDDDNLDCDNGFSGTVQFFLAIEDKNLANRGMECDNDANGSANQPITTVNVWNATFIGAGVQQANNEINDGLYLRRNSAPTVHNAIVTNFGNVGAVIDGDASWANVLSGDLVLDNILFFGNKTLASAAAQGAADPVAQNINRKGGAVGDYSIDGVVAAFAGRTFVFADPQLMSVDFDNPINGTMPDPRPAAGSPALDGANAATPTGNAVDASAKYLGAFSGDNWLAGWTDWATQ